MSGIDLSAPQPFVPSPPTGEAWTCRDCGARGVDDGTSNHTQTVCIQRLKAVRDAWHAFHAAEKALLAAILRRAPTHDDGGCCASCPAVRVEDDSRIAAQMALEALGEQVTP